MTAVFAGIVLYFFVAGCLFGHGLGTGESPTKNDPWWLQMLFATLIIFWPLAVLGGWLLGEDNNG